MPVYRINGFQLFPGALGALGDFTPTFSTLSPLYFSGWDIVVNEIIPLNKIQKTHFFLSEVVWDKLLTSPWQSSTSLGGKVLISLFRAHGESRPDIRPRRFLSQALAGKVGAADCDLALSPPLLVTWCCWEPKCPPLRQNSCIAPCLVHGARLV